jgi:hydroxymethylpyrimidine/phosphomethylpyrimidine kinase
MLLGSVYPPAPSSGKKRLSLLRLRMSLPVCLTIAGSDSGGGAGIQADLRSFNSCGTFGISVITAVTAQSPRAILSVYPIPIAEIANQLKVVLENFPVGAVKTGMLGQAAVVDLILDMLPPNVPLVADPVLRATSGAEFANQALLEAYPRLFARAMIATPNLDEADAFSDWPCPTLLKGGHRDQDRGCDLLTIDGQTYELRSPQLEMGEVHGTGCHLSAAIAARLAHGDDLFQATRKAKDWLHQALESRQLAGPFPLPGLVPDV